MANQQEDRDFIREQYVQYWEMLRLHSSFSWQVSATGIIAAIALIGLDQETLADWNLQPLIPSVLFLVVGLFMVLMLVHHQRNHLWVRRYEQAIAHLEERYGLSMEVHHIQVAPQLRGLISLSSSTALSVFLSVLAIGSLVTSLYFFVLSLVGHLA